jgi:hypothetical protein
LSEWVTRETCWQDVRNTHSAQSSRSEGHWNYQYTIHSMRSPQYSHSSYQSSQKSSIGHYGVQPGYVLSRNLLGVSTCQNCCNHRICSPRRQRRHLCVSEPCLVSRQNTRGQTSFNLRTAPSPELETRTRCHPTPTTAESSLGKAVTCKATCAEAQSFSSSLPSTCFFSMLSWPLLTACLHLSCIKLSSKALLVDTDLTRPSSSLE